MNPNTYQRLLLATVLVTSCDNPAVKDPGSSTTEISNAEDVTTKSRYDEVWIMRGWEGMMGVVIAISGDHCDQWFFSDVGSPSAMYDPVRCELYRTESGIRLRSDQPDSLYSTAWDYVDNSGERFLASAEDLRAGRDEWRWLRRVDKHLFAKHLGSGGPFVLQMNPQLESEQDGTGQPATRPASKSEGGDKPQPEAEGRSR
jgi:hypothetical protein